MTTTSGPPLAQGGFTDARSCKEWLNALPLINVPQAQAATLQRMRELNAAEFDGVERLKCLELMRDKIAFLLEEQRARHFGALPLAAADMEAWAGGLALIEELEAGYRRCASDAPSGSELAAHAALIAQRVARYVGARMLWHAHVYRRFDAELWSRLHRQYAEAEEAGIATTAVKDSLEGESGVSSAAEVYVQAVLMQAAPLAEMGAAHIAFAEALLRRWGRKLTVRAAAEAHEPTASALFVDLAKAEGPSHAAEAAPPASLRRIDTSALSLSLRKRIHGLHKGEDAVSMGLPLETSAVDALAELQRLHKRWCEVPPHRPAGRPPQHASASLVFGLAEAHFFVSGGKPFEQPGKSRELTTQEKQDIEVFGRITERTQSKMMGERRVAAESWPLVEEMGGAVRVERPAGAARPVAVARLVAVRLGDAGDFFLGAVSELAQEGDARVFATITFFPGKPQAIAVRASDPRHRTSTQWHQALRLPAFEKLHAPASLIVPAGLGFRGRALEIWEEGIVAATVQQVLARGADYDRITIL